MKNTNLAELDECHNVLLYIYDRIEKNEDYALPYLITPTSSFLNSEFRVLSLVKKPMVGEIKN